MIFDADTDTIVTLVPPEEFESKKINKFWQGTQFTEVETEHFIKREITLKYANV